jgi:hypothetical protein
VNEHRRDARPTLAKRAFGREQLKAWRGATDGSPQAELDFKFTRQATNKIGGISEDAAKFLRKFFWRVHPDERACSRASQHCPKIVTRNRGTRRGKPRR